MQKLTQSDVRNEMNRRKTQRQKLLDAFREKGELTTGEVIRLTGSGVSSRIHELRESGFKIVAVRETESCYRYVFTDKLPKHWKGHRMRNMEDISL